MKKIYIILMIIAIVLNLSACGTELDIKVEMKEKQNSIETTQGDEKTIEDTEAYIHGNSLGIFPIERTTDGIVLDKQETLHVEGVTYEVEFYRNLSYDAGLEGKYTFLVVNPLNNPDEEAPLWVYLHGGAAGYFTEDGDYEANWHQDETTWNKEETFNSMVKSTLPARLYTAGELRDNTLVRRLKEGYRMLVVSYSDHDTYLGVGTEYPNNPNGGEVNGLQATMSAVDYVTASYPTNDVFAYGSSAGAFGAYGVGVAYYMEGTKLTGIVADSGVPVYEIMNLWDYYAGQPDDWFTKNWDSQAMMEKVGPFGDLENKLLAEDMIKKGFDVPILGISGKEDHWFRAYFPIMDAAVENGFDTNADWVYSNLINAIDEQENSPHELLLLDDTGHVPTIAEHQIANDAVDEFIMKTKEYSPDYPFGG